MIDGEPGFLPLTLQNVKGQRAAAADTVPYIVKRIMTIAALFLGSFCDYKR